MAQNESGSFEQQQMEQKQQDFLQSQGIIEMQFEEQKKQVLQTLLQAEQTVQQTESALNSQSLKLAQQQLQQVTQQLNQMQGLAVTQTTTASKQQLEQVRQQIMQASQTLSLIESLNNANNSFKKG